MIHAGDYDLVAGIQPAGQGTGDMKGEGGHVRAEHDLVRGRGVQKVCHSGVRLVQDCVRLLAGGKGALMVGVTFQ